MNVLGIETSCDETSTAIVRDGKDLLSCETFSSLKLHEKFGGVIPEIASRMQLETISQATEVAFKRSGIKLRDIGLISVTGEPGLLGSLLVGISFARALSLGLNKPLLEVNHLHSHIYASFLNSRPVGLPFIALIVSGGHTSIYIVRDFDDMKILGATQDDACGEAFDKVGKILGLGYPGGPHIEKLAKKGNPEKIKFKCSETKEPLNFSFSGIKTAVLYLLKDKPAPIYKKEDIAASFQETVIETLRRKSFLACKAHKVNRLVIGGGVAANNRLREIFNKNALKEGIKVYFPEKRLCMDNAAMVAGLAYRLFKKGGKQC